MNKEEIIEFYLKRFTLGEDKPAYKLNKQNIEKEEIKNVLDGVGLLTISSRLNYIWYLDYVIENTILENIHLSDELLIINKISTQMKELFPSIKISEERFKRILSNRYIKSINSMRALSAICYGEIDTFNDYDKNNKYLLANYITKTLILSNVNLKDIENNFEEAKELTNDNQRNHPINSILKFQWCYDDSIGDEFRAFMKDKKVVYLDGVLNILKDCTDKEKLNETLESKLESKYNNINSIETDTNELNIHQKYEEVTTGEIYIDNDKLISVKSTIKENLMKSLSLLEELKEENNSTIIEEIKAKNEEIENENKRLKHEIEVLKYKASSTSLKEFIQKMGGPEFGYQLTDLYLLSEDILADDGNIPGRLLNMFSLLEMYNIEPYTSEKIIDEEFGIELKELGQKYNLETPIKGNDEKIKVKLVKYGWKQNNFVIVSPLVKQII